MAAGTHAPMFGLAVSAPFDVAGVPDADAGEAAARPFGLTVTSRRELLGARPATGCQRLSDRRDEAGRNYLRVDSHPTAGTFIVMRGEGAYRISADARHAQLAPARMADWRWQRVLIGQVLPYAALLNGLEVLHASAVTFGAGAIAITGGSHSGKSALATTLMGRGAALVADDVVAVEVTGGQPIVHPGPRLLSVREGTLRIAGAAAISALGREVGTDAHGTRIAVNNAQAGPLPLGALVVMRRHDGHDELSVQRLQTPDPRLILGSTFNFVVKTPQRMTAHLDLAATIAATIPVLKADVGTGHEPEAVADAVMSVLEAGA